MPTPSLEEPSTKIAVHLYARDVAYIRAHDQRTISGVLRDLLRAHCRAKRKEAIARSMEWQDAQRD